MRLSLLPGVTEQRAAVWGRASALLLAFVVFVGVITGAGDAHATPWMSLQAGTPCATCHTNVQGGGGRTEIGWGNSLYTGMFTYDQLGFNWLANRETNEIVPGYVSFGYDVRAQSARIGAPSITFTRCSRISRFRRTKRSTSTAPGTPVAALFRMAKRAGPPTRA